MIAQAVRRMNDAEMEKTKGGIKKRKTYTKHDMLWASNLTSKKIEKGIIEGKTMKKHNKP